MITFQLLLPWVLFSNSSLLTSSLILVFVQQRSHNIFGESIHRSIKWPALPGWQFSWRGDWLNRRIRRSWWLIKDEINTELCSYANSSCSHLMLHLIPHSFIDGLRSPGKCLPSKVNHFFNRRLLETGRPLGVVVYKLTRQWPTQMDHFP